ncbi:MAG: hypothetical protein HWE25_01955 [Alphaproteobacteria bacterium]|nr:hypothetical protein [Alphaproteobacteria bacterium]
MRYEDTRYHNSIPLKSLFILPLLAMLLAETGAYGQVQEAETCGSYVDKFEAGLPGVSKLPDMSARDGIELLSINFREVMRASDQAMKCFSSARNHAVSKKHKEAIEAGIGRTAWVFATAQSQFEQSLDALSSQMLTDLAPAAGGNTEALPEDDAMVRSMEILFDSYMLFERSQELSRRFTGVAPVTE